MKTQELEELLGVECVCMDDEGRVFSIETDVFFTDQDPVPGYVEVVDSQLRFSDATEVLLHFEMRGLEIDEGWFPAFIPAIVGQYGVKVEEFAFIELWSTLDDAVEAFARFRAALKVLVQWEHDQFAATGPRAVLSPADVAALPSMA
ncbi:MAG: hypothetical protein ABIT83_04470 [Massilia sp.]